MPERGWYGTRHVAFWTIVTGVCAVIALTIALASNGGRSPGPQPTSSQSAVIPVAQTSSAAPTASSAAPTASSQPSQPSPSASQPQPSTQPTQPTTQPAVASVPSGYQGTWTGWATTRGGEFSVAVQVGSGSVGSQIGEYAIVNGDCRGVVYLVAVGASSITVREDFTYNGLPTCSTAAVVDLIPDNGALEYDVIADQFANGQAFQGNGLAYGTLTQQ